MPLAVAGVGVGAVLGVGDAVGVGAREGEGLEALAEGAAKLAWGDLMQPMHTDATTRMPKMFRPLARIRGSYRLFNSPRRHALGMSGVYRCLLVSAERSQRTRSHVMQANLPVNLTALSTERSLRPAGDLLGAGL